MSKDTSISWTDATFNPWWGCTRVSPACGMPVPGHEGEEHGVCYADSLSNRYGFKIWGQDVGRRTFEGKHWMEPLKWGRKPDGSKRLVFCGSMCDVMEDRRELDRERAKLWPLIERTEDTLIWLLTTKRPQNFRRLFPSEWSPYPPSNVWAITTVETQEYVWRIHSMMENSFMVYGVSCEPLLGEIALPDSFLSLGQCAWVIGGGESGRGARPTQPDWARRLRDDSQSHGVPFHWKQWGEWCDTDQLPESAWDTLDIREEDEGRIRRWGKKAAGALLDGREWREFPKTKGATTA